MGLAGAGIAREACVRVGACTSQRSGKPVTHHSVVRARIQVYNRVHSYPHIDIHTFTFTRIGTHSQTHVPRPNAIKL